MKRFVILLIAIVIAMNVFAQSKTAYMDIYQRGGAQHLRTTIIFDDKPIYLGRKNIGEILNVLAASGWTVDRTFNVRRFGLPTRHKFHIILKKEYREGENPFDGISSDYINTRKVGPVQDSIFIQKGITEVKKSEFYNRLELNTVYIHKDVVKIGDFAFSYCINLKAVYCEPVTPPDLGSLTFNGAPKTFKIYVPYESVEKYRSAAKWKKYADQIVGYAF